MKGNTLLFVSYFFTLIVLFALLILALIFQDLPSPYGTTFNPFDRYAPFFAPLAFLSIVCVIANFAVTLSRIAEVEGKIGEKE